MRERLRFWRRRPLSLAAVVVSIGLGTAVAVTTVAAVRAMFWRTLSMADPGQLVSVTHRPPGDSAAGVRKSIHGLELVFWRERQDVFDDLAAYASGLQMHLLLEGGAEEVRDLRVTGSFFDLLGVPAAAGRMFTEADVEAGQQLAVLSHAGWTRLFARDPAVIGRSLHLDHPWTGTSVARGALVTIAGVAIPEFDVDWSVDGTSVDIFTVLHNPAAQPAVNVVGRLRAGVTREVAEARMSDMVARAVREVYSPTFFAADWPPAGARVTSLHEDLYGDARPLVRVLLVAGALLVLIGCASAAATLLTMASRRARDVAIQQALGRAVGDLRRGLLLEGLCLGLLAGVAALVAARGLVGAVLVLGPASMPRMAATQLGWVEAGVAGLLAAACGVVAALIPAVIVRPDAFEAMREGGTATSARPTIRWRQGLLAAQVALVLGLVVTAGLMLGTLHTLATRPLGFSMDRVLVAELLVPDEIRTDAGRSRVFVERVLEAARTVPGARTVALASEAPLSGLLGLLNVYPSEAGPGSRANVHRVGPGYFDLLGIPIVTGQDLTTYDGAGHAVLVNVSFAREHYGSPAAALGRWLRWGNRDWPPHEIIGVVGDTRQRGLRHALPPVLYVPLIADRAGAPLVGGLSILTREQGDPVLATGNLRAALRAVDSRWAVHVAPLADRFRDEIAEERLLALSLAVLGGSTLLLAVFGIVALVGQLVTDRSRELALRLVLGSSPAAIQRLVMRGVLVPTLAGTAAGLLLAWWSAGLIRQFLFETSPYDATLWALAVGSLLVAALAGAWWPARRALRIDPAQVLRWE
jgi:predicted permease